MKGFSGVSDNTVSTWEMAKSIGITRDEYEHVCAKLERKPRWAELGIFSAMFSEHCSYKSSKPYLRRFPTTGKRVLQGPGENAGVLDIGGDWAIAFKMESHNHPSFIEPFQGAATGVGGILRDVFTMGARPIASMDALCFGMPDYPKTAAVVRGVVKGVGDYGNSVGVPTVGGQTLFHPCYNQNPLVNAFTLGLVRKDKIFLGKAEGVGNWVVYTGARTGRDGVHGATMASQEFSTEKEPDRPTVQVGDPFTEKLLLEATLEVMDKGLVVGIQDMGAAGLTSSSFEMAARAGTGLEIDLDKIPTRESGMSGYELLLSESQERMLLVIEPAKWEGLKKVFDKWDLHAEVIGKVVEGSRVQMTKGGEQVVDLPVDLVTEPLMAERPCLAPGDLKQRWFFDRNKLLLSSVDSKFQTVFNSLCFANPEPLTVQYDSMVGNRTEGGSFDDSAVIRVREIKDRKVRLGVTADCNPRVCWLWPKEGGRRAVSEAAINLACRGLEAIGLTDCLNFGNPENPEVMWQFSECVDGISEACEALGLPVVSGNVSLYNDTDGKPIYPTPMIGMVGFAEGDYRLPLNHLFSTSLDIALIGPKEGGLGGSLLTAEMFRRECGQPEETDMKAVKRVLKFLSILRSKRFVNAVHDISDGGLALCALEMAFRCPYKEIGLELRIPRETDPDGFLFGETIPRILLAFNPSEGVEIEAIAGQVGIGMTLIGSTNDQGHFAIRQGGALVTQASLPDLKKRWDDRWKGFFR